MTPGLAPQKATTAWLVPLDVLAHRRGGDDPRVVGGKAARLAWLVRHGFDVPEAVVLPAEAFSHAIRELPPGCEPRALLRAAAGRAGYVRAAEARQQILTAPLPKGLNEELTALWYEVGARSPWGLAVRSSATCEDGALVSMAGLAESILGVRGPEALRDAVRQVWASIASGRALAYLAAHGVRDVGMALVVQRMVEARAAGVMFTRAPGAHGGSDDRIINAGLGLGAPVVNRVATPFTWSVAGAFSEAGFRSAFAALGCRVPKHARLVGNVHGRIYLNLTQFMRIAAQVPFLDPRTLVELGGGWGGDELAVQVQDVSRSGFYARLPMTASRLLREQLSL